MSEFPVKQFVNHLLEETGQERVEVELGDQVAVAQVAEELRDRGYEVVQDPFKLRIIAIRTSVSYSP